MITRRSLLLAGSCLFLPVSVPSWSQASAAEHLLGGGQFQDGTGHMRYVLSCLNLATGKADLLDMDFLPHGIHWHAQQPMRLAVFEKKGPHACEVDLQRMLVSREIPLISGRYFYGHGCYSADNRLLFSTETWLDGKDGVIAVRDADSLEYLGEFPSFGKEPHECKLIDNGRVLVITNAGGVKGDAAPCVTWVDVQTRQLLQRSELTDAGLNTGHIAIAADGSLVVVSAPRTGLDASAHGGVSIQPRGQALLSMAAPLEVVRDMRGEALSVCIDDASGRVLVTHPDANMVTLWSIRDRHFLARLDLPRPRGVCLSGDGQGFLVSCGTLPGVLRVPVDHPEHNAVVVENSWITGSHLYNRVNALDERQHPALIS
jgi:uncharacterized protein